MMVESSRKHIRVEWMRAAAHKIKAWYGTSDIRRRVKQIQQSQALRTNPATRNFVARKLSPPSRVARSRSHGSRGCGVVNGEWPVGKISLSFQSGWHLSLRRCGRLTDPPTFVARKPECLIFAVVKLRNPNRAS